MTKSKEQNHSRVVNEYSRDEENTRLLQNSKVHYRLHTKLALISIMRQINPIVSYKLPF